MEDITASDIAPYIEQKLITARSNEGLTIYNYTEHCVYERAWDDVTLQCRGLIINDETGEVVARPFGKFFNHGEPDGAIPEWEPDLISDKRDGSLGISYRAIDGRQRWSTRGSMTSPQAAIAERIWATQYANAAIDPDLTVMVEIESPEIESIIPATEDLLVLIGIRRISDGQELTWGACCEWAEKVGMPVADDFDYDLPTCVEMAKTLPIDHEGWVLRWELPDGSTHRLKVKGSEFMAVARLMKSMSPRRVADIWYAGRDDLFEKVPEEFRPDIEAQRCALAATAEALERTTNKAMAKINGMTRKEAVMAVGPKAPHFSAVMRMLDGKAPDFRLMSYREHTGYAQARPAIGHHDDESQE